MSSSAKSLVGLTERVDAVLRLLKRSWSSSATISLVQYQVLGVLLLTFHSLDNFCLVDTPATDFLLFDILLIESHAVVLEVNHHIPKGFHGI